MWWALRGPRAARRSRRPRPPGTRPARTRCPTIPSSRAFVLRVRERAYGWPGGVSPGREGARGAGRLVEAVAWGWPVGMLAAGLLIGLALLWRMRAGRSGAARRRHRCRSSCATSTGAWSRCSRSCARWRTCGQAQPGAARARAVRARAGGGRGAAGPRARRRAARGAGEEGQGASRRPLAEPADRLPGHPSRAARVRLGRRQRRGGGRARLRRLAAGQAARSRAGASRATCRTRPSRARPPTGPRALDDEMAQLTAADRARTPTTSRRASTWPSSTCASATSWASGTRRSTCSAKQPGQPRALAYQALVRLAMGQAGRGRVHAQAGDSRPTRICSRAICTWRSSTCAWAG